MHPAIQFLLLVGGVLLALMLYSVVSGPLAGTKGISS
jgi:hypothetical protein